MSLISLTEWDMLNSLSILFAVSLKSFLIGFDTWAWWILNIMEYSFFWKYIFIWYLAGTCPASKYNKWIGQLLSMEISVHTSMNIHKYKVLYVQTVYFFTWITNFCCFNLDLRWATTNVTHWSGLFLWCIFTLQFFFYKFIFSSI